ncbi:MAG: hypothetical protein E7338_03165 [Clostridiales bacterium]|nr:hypothetical protein [Clostridiales bacterium]
MVESKRRWFTKKEKAAYIALAIVTIVIICSIVILSQFYSIHGFYIFKKQGIWEFRITNEKLHYAMIQTRAELPEIIAPTTMYDTKITHIYARNINKIFLDQSATSVIECLCKEVILISANGEMYKNGLKNHARGSGYYKIEAKRICVPQEYLEVYQDMYNAHFCAANVSYMLNYTSTNQQGYQYVTKQANEDAWDYINEHREDFVYEDGYVYKTDVVDAFIEENYGRFIDTSSYNGGYHWVDYLEEGDKILTIPSDPAREGYSFRGWYLDAACTNIFDFNSYVKDETPLVLYAGWDIN